MGQAGGNFRKLSVESPITSVSGRGSHKQEYVQEAETELNVSESGNWGEEKGVDLSRGKTTEQQPRNPKLVVYGGVEYIEWTWETGVCT